MGEQVELAPPEVIDPLKRLWNQGPEGKSISTEGRLESIFWSNEGIVGRVSDGEVTLAFRARFPAGTQLDEQIAIRNYLDEHHDTKSELYFDGWYDCDSCGDPVIEVHAISSTYSEEFLFFETIEPWPTEPVTPQ